MGLNIKRRLYPEGAWHDWQAAAKPHEPAAEAHHAPSIGHATLCRCASESHTTVIGNRCTIPSCSRTTRLHRCPSSHSCKM